MVDYPNIIDAIRQYLATRDRGKPGELAELATRYADACRATNDRLNRCARYLQKGLRSEAVHLADVQPNLAETVALLQFSEGAEWLRACGANGLSTAPPLLAQTLADLEKARDREHELEPLLAQHRMLSFATEPALYRAAVLTALVERDAQNPNWKQQLQTLEPLRLEEIRQASIAAIAERDASKIEALLKLLAEPHWTVTPPKDIQEPLQAVFDELKAAENLPPARRLTTELLAAAASGNLELAVDLHRQWTPSVEKLPARLRDELADEAGPAIHWLEAERSKRVPELKPLTAVGERVAVSVDEPQKEERSIGHWVKIIVVIILALVVAVLVVDRFIPILKN